MSDGSPSTKPVPTEIRYQSAEKMLEVDFNTGEAFCLSTEMLRVEIPSAEVQGHSPGQRQTVGGKRFVGITKIEPVGHVQALEALAEPVDLVIAARLIGEDCWIIPARLAHHRYEKESRQLCTARRARSAAVSVPSSR